MELRPYNLGCVGLHQTAGKNIRYSAAEASSYGDVTIFTIPGQSIIKSIDVRITQAFNAPSNSLSVGYDANVENLVPAASINPAVTGMNSFAVNHYVSAQAVVKARYAQGGSGPAASAGNAEVYVHFVRVGV